MVPKSHCDTDPGWCCESLCAGWSLEEEVVLLRLRFLV
jgi:hypothetical protein